MKTLILYYSYGGNTKRIAEMIQREIGGDIARMGTVVSYDGDYDEVVNQGQRETAEGYCPELKPLHIGWRDYDTIILGSPVWWYTFAPAMRSFLEQADLTGKIVYPFATNGGWPGHALKDFEEACKGAIVMPGLDVHSSMNPCSVLLRKIFRHGLIQSADNQSAAFGIRHRAGKGLGRSQKCKQSVPTSRRNALFPFVPFFLAFTGRPGSWGWQSPLCSSFTTSREISQSTACLVGGEGPSSPTPRSCSALIPKGACGRYRPLAYRSRIRT